MRKSEVSSTLTVYHDGQFWVGVVEHVENGMLSVARLVFGAEPSNEEVYTWVLERWCIALAASRARRLGLPGSRPTRGPTGSASALRRRLDQRSSTHV